MSSRSFHSSAVGGPTGQYYLVHGAIALVGRIYGAVDFEVIRVDVEVIVKVTVQFRIEAYHPIVVELTAEVSVRASITILFITVHFSFSLSVSQTFTIPALESGTAPWQIGGGSGPPLLPLPAFDPHKVTTSPSGRSGAYNLVWRALKLWSTPQNWNFCSSPSSAAIRQPLRASRYCS